MKKLDWTGYKAWVKEGKAKKYDWIMTLLLLPWIIILCVEYYLLGKMNAENKIAIKELEASLKKYDDLPDDGPIVSAEPEQKENKYAFNPEKYNCASRN